MPVLELTKEKYCEIDMLKMHLILTLPDKQFIEDKDNDQWTWSCFKEGEVILPVFSFQAIVVWRFFGLISRSVSSDSWNSTFALSLLSLGQCDDLYSVLVPSAYDEFTILWNLIQLTSFFLSNMRSRCLYQLFYQVSRF